MLVFGSDTSAFLGTVRSLGRQGIEVHAAGCDERMPAAASRYISRIHDIPFYEKDGTAWLQRIRTLVARYDYALLIPTSDASLAQLAAHRETLGERRIAAPGDEALALFSDKWATREAALALDIPVPEARLVTGPMAASEVERELGLPVILKSRRSYTVGDTIQKTAVALLDSEDALQSALSSSDQAMVEGFIPGFCRGVSVIAMDGELLQAFQHVRKRQEHATGPSSWRVSEPLDGRLLDAARKLIAFANYTGVAMFEFRFDETGQDFVLLEVNPRFWGSMQLASDAGADYATLLHGMLTKGTKPEKHFGFTPDLHKRSVWGEFDALSQAWSDGGGPVARLGAVQKIVQFLYALTKKDGFDSYAPDDPAPFLIERRQVLARFRARITGNEPLGGRMAARDR